MGDSYLGIIFAAGVKYKVVPESRIEPDISNSNPSVLSTESPVYPTADRWLLFLPHFL